MSLWEDLTWRGLVHQSTDEEALQELLDGPSATFYVGFDPTAPSLHIGNLVQILTARRLQDAGHRPLLLVGGATGLVGDPKMSGERVMNSPEVVAGWVEKIRNQIAPFISFDGPNAGVLVNNLDWIGPMSAIELLRDIGKYFRVGKMLSKEAVSARLNSTEGISYTEFSYQLMQGLDYLELLRTKDCRLQLGGSDQWGNITSGVDLIHKAEGVSVHALATPLVTKADGTKFGKTETGTVWMSPELTSPYAFYQFWLNSEDSMVGTYLRIFTFRDRAQIEELDRLTTEEPHKRAGQKALAEDLTRLVHGDHAFDQVTAASQVLFGGGDVHALEHDTLRDSVQELPHAVVPEVPIAVIDALVGAGLSASRKAARRTIDEGGAYVNNVKVTDPDAVIDKTDLLHGRFALIRRGRKALGAIVHEG